MQMLPIIFSDVTHTLTQMSQTLDRRLDIVFFFVFPTVLGIVGYMRSSPQTSCKEEKIKAMSRTQPGLLRELGARV